jgi:dihydroneopterin aldolase
MTDDIHMAFAHPEERSKAMMPQADRISLRDYIIGADIGAFQQERGQEQRLRFNVVVELQPQGGAGDDVDRILSYDAITNAIAVELAAERLNLLETLAERIAARILIEPQPARVFIRIEKLDRGPGALGVEIVRSRDAAPQVADAFTTRPVVVYLDNATIAGGEVAARLDAVAVPGTPMIVTVGLPDAARPEAAGTVSQRRIDLLAIEQNAWTLVAAGVGCTVVATRTELDWAIGQGNRVVWAPSKLVLDTPGAPLEQAGDGLALAIWLAELLDARELVIHGSVSTPAGSRVPVRRV